MQRLLKHLNVKEEKTAVFGDWYNDLSLFESNALKITPQNAIAELKKSADYVIKKTNNEDGVADFLRSFIKS